MIIKRNWILSLATIDSYTFCLSKNRERKGEKIYIFRNLTTPLNELTSALDRYSFSGLIRLIRISLKSSMVGFNGEREPYVSGVEHESGASLRARNATCNCGYSYLPTSEQVGIAAKMKSTWAFFVRWLVFFGWTPYFHSRISSGNSISTCPKFFKFVFPHTLDLTLYVQNCHVVKQWTEKVPNATTLEIKTGTYFHMTIRHWKFQFEINDLIMNRVYLHVYFVLFIIITLFNSVPVNARDAPCDYWCARGYRSRCIHNNQEIETNRRIFRGTRSSDRMPRVDVIGTVARTGIPLCSSSVHPRRRTFPNGYTYETGGVSKRGEIVLARNQESLLFEWVDVE